MYCNDYLRTDIKFKNLEYMGEYQRGETILNQLPHVGLVSNVPLDSMHLVYLGAMKQLIRHWIGDKDRKKKLFKLSDQQIEQISCRLESLKNVLPYVLCIEFNRRSRSHLLEAVESHRISAFFIIFWLVHLKRYFET